MTEEKQMEAAALVREKNPNAVIITTPWDDLTGQQILDAIEGTHSLAKELMEEHEHEHHHHHDGECGCGHHHDHDGECGCGHHHDHDHEEHEHHHDHDHEGHEHHHDHDHEGHEHHYDENGVCSCGHHHDHDHHHHADEVFTSWGKETPRKYSREELDHILKTLNESEEFGMILRAKGMLPCTDGTWMHFDLVPEEYEIRTGAADYTGRLCVIGSKLKEDKLEELFLLK